MLMHCTFKLTNLWGFQLNVSLNKSREKFHMWVVFGFSVNWWNNDSYDQDGLLRPWIPWHKVKVLDMNFDILQSGNYQCCTFPLKKEINK